MPKICALTMMLMLIASQSAWAGEQESVVKRGIKTIVSETVSAGKDVVSGVAEGIDAGRKDGESTDGAKIVSNKAELKKLLTVSVIKNWKLASGQYEVTLAIHNANDFPVRITNLNKIGNVVLLDQDGFSVPLPNSDIQGKDITALGKSSTRVRFIFADVEGTPAIFRLFDHDIKIP